MSVNASLFLSVNDFARATPWLHGPMSLLAGYGLVVFAGLLLAGWWIARRDGDPIRMAAALWAPLGTLLAVAVNQPIVALVQEQRPYDALPGILVLATPTTDPGFPSDHATVVGAVTAGLFLVNRRLGWVAALVAAACWRSAGCTSPRITRSTSPPASCSAPRSPSPGWILLRRVLIRLVDRMRHTRTPAAAGRGTERIRILR